MSDIYGYAGKNILKTVGISFYYIYLKKYKNKKIF
jgi:hypothetical protein